MPDRTPRMLVLLPDDAGEATIAANSARVCLEPIPSSIEQQLRAILPAERTTIAYFSRYVETLDESAAELIWYIVPSAHESVTNQLQFVRRRSPSAAVVACINAKAEIETELHLLRAGALEVICLCDLTANSVERIIQQSLARHQHEMRYLKSIDRLEIANSQLQRQARIDGLTGIPNRRAFDELIRSEWRRSFRTKQWLSLALVDIDYFKQYNDSLGHIEGDRCLIAVAHALAHHAKRAGDVVARYGGEEFALIIPGTDIVKHVPFLDSFRNCVEQLAIPHPNSPVSDVVTITIGAASCQPASTRMGEQFLQAVDRQLYLAKASGRNQVLVSSLQVNS